MRVSLSWIKEYVPVDMSAPDIAEALTMAGLEVEGFFDRYAWLDKVVTVKILSVSAHPDADRLSICEVEAGDGRYSIVCGAPNVFPDMITALALPGTVLPSGLTVKKGKIRGVVSEGMLCSQAELSLGEEASGIMALDVNLAAGLPLNRALGLYDPVFEIDLTPNRPDCLCVIGVAREIAAFSRAKVSLPEITLAEGAPDVDDYTSVTIDDPDLCPRYVARVVTNVTVGPSPFWLRDRLLSAGLKPINNIVDITNFVMMETGQPLHAFDLDRLSENRIVVRRAGETPSFVTLDEKERRLSPDMLMICDAQKPVAVAGVMGGMNSEIQDTTGRVLIESACFKPTSIRRTAKALNMSSDASYRFERGVDPGGTVAAANRAAQLMAALAGGRVARGCIDNNPLPAPARIVAVGRKQLNSRLGTDLAMDEISGFLEAVGFGVTQESLEQISVAVPSFRVDVERPEDISEEVARLWGYDNIPVTFPRNSLAAAGVMESAFENKARIKEVMSGFGFIETVNYSFISREVCAAMGFSRESSQADPIEILNPLAVEQSVMRTSLIPGLLLTMRHNIAQQIRDMRLFEIGRVFWRRENSELPEEPDLIAALQTGRRQPGNWLSPDQECAFYDLKGVCECLFSSLGSRSVSFTALPDALCTFTRPGHTARVYADGREVGLIGEVSQPLLVGLGIKQTVFVWEFDLAMIMPLLTARRQMTPLPRFPAVTRDITVIVDAALEAEQILNFLAAANDELIESVTMMDVYEGQPVPSGKKSLSARMVYRSRQKTLQDKFVNVVHAEIAERLIKAFSAELPV